MTATSAPLRAGAVAIARPPRRRGRRRIWLWALAGLLVLLGAAAAYVVGYSSMFATTAVTVRGEHVLSNAEVRSAAQVPLGRPLARQDVDRIAANVAQLRPVRMVRVEREWPHTIAVRVVERTPVLGVWQPDGLLLLDREGVGYQTVPARPDGVVRADVDPTYTALVADVADVAAALPKKLKADVESIEARSPTGITVVLDSGLRVTWGSSDESALKAEITLALLERRPQTINVSAPHNPATT